MLKKNTQQQPMDNDERWIVKKNKNTVIGKIQYRGPLPIVREFIFLLLLSFIY